jgi:hypothetical protein
LAQAIQDWKCWGKELGEGGNLTIEVCKLSDHSKH